MRIAICDDDINFAGELKGAIETLYDVSMAPLRFQSGMTALRFLPISRNMTLFFWLSAWLVWTGLPLPES